MLKWLANIRKLPLMLGLGWVFVLTCILYAISDTAGTHFFTNVEIDEEAQP